MTRIITLDEIQIIAAAEGVLRSLCTGPVSSVALSAYQGCGGMVGVSAVSTGRKAYSENWREPMAGGLQTALNKLYADYPGDCVLAQRRVSELQAELEKAREHAATVCEAQS